ncbi:MAG: MCE family protein [Phycisphaerales bacterium]|nr:MCE family protein [Phycisphaerales bacterium]
MSVAVIKKNNVMAGSFLIGSFLLALIIAFTLGDLMGRFGEKNEYIVRFPTTVGVMGLTNGSQVTFAGLPVGRVISVTPYMQTDADSGITIPVAMDVTIHIDTGFKVHEDAYADLSPPILGGISTINIASAGTGSYDGGPSDANTVLDAGEILRGRFAPSILTQLGFTTEEAERIKEIIARSESISINADEVSASVRRMVETLEPDFDSSVADSRATIANIRAFSDKLAGENGWSSRVDDLFIKGNTVMDDVQLISADVKQATGSVNEMIDTNRERIDHILADAEDMTANIKAQITPTTERINTLLDDGVLALGSYREIAENTNSILLNAQPKIDATLDNIRFASAQGSMFVEEIRSQPWRLLKKPTKDDLQREPLYEAARIYASAVGDLRAASEALDAAVSGQTPSATATDIARIAKVVGAAYGRYEVAERGLLKVLKAPVSP